LAFASASFAVAWASLAFASASWAFVVASAAASVASRPSVSSANRVMRRMMRSETRPVANAISTSTGSAVLVATIWRK
jgi:phosphatidylserine decarboxylase